MSGGARAQQVEENQIPKKDNGSLQLLKDKYEDLPPPGKFAATAVVGFFGSRVALKTFVGAAKVAGAAFIATEVLSASGVLDDMPPFVDDHVQTVTSVKDRVLLEADKFRKGVRKSLKKEKMAALGFASGAFVGIIL